MTRVLMTADAVGGVWTYALELADALARHDVEVVLAVLGPRPDGGQRRAVAASAVAAVHEAPFALEWQDEPWPDVDAAGAWLAELEAEARPDVVHLNGYALAAQRWQARTVVVAHSCVASWWSAVHGGAPPRRYDEYRRRVTAGLAAADAVVAPTTTMLGELSRWYGHHGGSVVPNGRRDEAVPASAKEPFVLAAGRAWDEAKNVAALDAVAARIPWPIAIAGDEARPGAARDPGGDVRSARRLGVLSAPDLRSWMARAAVFAAPARYEPFGLGALEAGLAGCALVLGDIPTLREVWGDAAVYVAPDDHDALATTLTRLAADPATCEVLSRRARGRALLYPPERMAAGYLSVYRSLPARCDR